MVLRVDLDQIRGLFYLWKNKYSFPWQWVDIIASTTGHDRTSFAIDVVSRHNCFGNSTRSTLHKIRKISHGTNI